MKRFLLAITLVLISLCGGQAVMAQSDEPIPLALFTIADNEDVSFSILIELVSADTDLLFALTNPSGSYTLFAPTDEAFEDFFDTLGITKAFILEDEELLGDVLRYHLLRGDILSERIAERSEIRTLAFETISITVDDGDILLNETVSIISADIEARNGIIHIIDNVLFPVETSDTEAATTDAPSGEACTVSTTDANTVRVRVGPGNNRTSINFLATDTSFEVLGQSEDDGGNIWYQLDKEEASPGRAINEAWILANEVDSAGDCASVGEASAPPVIPIVPAAPANPPANSGGDTSENPAPAPQSGARPNAGTWAVSLNPTTNISCVGTSNLPVPTSDLFSSSVIRVSSSYSGSTFIFDNTAMQSIGDGVYRGATTIDGVTGTFFIDQVVTPNQMVGRFIGSFEGCSFTVTWVANR